VKIELAETYDANGLPKPGGLLDLRLGTNDRNYKCATCAGSMAECPGHFGHLELAKPVFHVGYINKIKKVLESVCFYCSRLKCSEELLRTHQPKSLKDARSRLNMVWSLCRGKMVCQTTEISGENGEPQTGKRSGCGHRQPVIRREGLRLFISFKAQSEVFL
jgi:DNA-directed RNA polymerase II subunit RPB1